ncbi:hypothetical protein JW921_08615 [Candidatus Fermentibacterales bacterium]|nr:hypothetical protein [Candidatus Fermentibacterales bacterium]
MRRCRLLTGLVVLALTACGSSSPGDRAAGGQDAAVGSDSPAWPGVGSAEEWRNPYLVACPDGYMLRGSPEVLPVGSLAEVLEALPDTCWPYGRVVAVQEAGMGSGFDKDSIEAMQRRILEALEALDMEVELFPSS